MSAVSDRRREQERELLRQAHAGDAAARDAMIERGMALVMHVARRYDQRGVDFEELVQVGSIGLINAVDRFDLDRGVTFSTFAVPHIAGEIRRHFRDRTWAVRVSRSVQENAALVSRVSDRLSVSLQRPPTIREIAAEAELSVDQVLEALDGARQYAAESMQTPYGREEDQDATLGDMIASHEKGYEAAENHLMLVAGMRHLQQREQKILALRFGRGMKQTEIAAEMGISQMHVSRLIAQSLDQLREHFTGSGAAAEPPLRAVAS